MIRVICVDEDLGEVGVQELRPGGYVLVVGEKLYLAGEVFHRNGTRVLTLAHLTDTEDHDG